MERKWQIQEAKSKFSELIDEASKNVHQIITKHGKDTAVIISIEEYKKLTQQNGSLVDFFKNSPLAGESINLEREKDKPREFDF